MMRICFVGVGSIAKRHIRNLRAIGEKRGMPIMIDAYRHGNNSDVPDGVDTVFNDLDSLPDDYDAVFITNPTEYHLNAIKDFHNKGKNFFIEKPLVSVGQIEAALEYNKHDDSVYYVAAPLRYNAVIQYIKDSIDLNSVISVRCISSSYLPDWRPNQDYRKTYSAQKALGGGVSIDLIHEWDYVSYLLGKPQKIHSLIGKKSKLEIDSDDYAIYIAEFKDKIAEIHLDYFGRKTIREIQLFTDEETIVGDLANNRISFLKSGNTIDFNEERDDYQIRELEYFLDMITGAKPKSSEFDHALEVLNFTQGKV